MDSSFITLGILGLVAGFIFSMPVAGPISFLITSYALKGKQKYAYQIAAGGVLSDSFYCFISVFGSSQLLELLNKYIPFLLMVGSVFVFAIGIKVFSTKHLTLEVKTNENEVNRLEKLGHKKIKSESGFMTGFWINLLNPTLLLTWLAASLLIFSIASSLGLNTGDFGTLLTQNSGIISKLDNSKDHTLSQQLHINPDAIKAEPIKTEKSFLRLLIASLVYSIMLSLGTLLWLMLYARLLVKFRKYLKEHILLIIVKVLGVLLVGFGVYLFSKAVSMMQLQG